MNSYLHFLLSGYRGALARRPMCLLLVCLVALLSLLRLFGISLAAMPPCREASYPDARFRGIVCSREENGTGTVLTLRNTPYGKVKIRAGFGENYSLGTCLLVKGDAERFSRPENPGEFDRELYYRTQGIFYEVKGAEILSAEENGTGFRNPADAVREKLTVMRNLVVRRMYEAFPEETAAVFCALLTGDRSGLTEEMKARWREGGIIHMLAISGLHISLIGSAVFNILMRVGAGLPVSGSISAVLVLCYTLFTGASVSSVRAFLMFFLMIGAKLAKRTYDPLSAISCAGILILLENPCYLLYPGFQMSFAAVLIAVLFGPRGKGMMSLMFCLGMMPLILVNYYEIPLYSIPVNMLVVPALPFLLASGVVGSLFGGWMAFPAVAMVKGLDLLLELAGRMPFSKIVLGKLSPVRIILYYLFLSLFVFLITEYRLFAKRFLLYLLIPPMVLVLALRVRTGIAAVFLSVGQGEGIVIELPDGENLMIDAGSSSVKKVGEYRVEPFLKCEGIGKLDAVFATHMDEDHISGIREILERGEIRVGMLVVPVRRSENEAYRDLVGLAERRGARVVKVLAGDRFRFGGTGIEVLAPDMGLYEETDDENAGSLVIGLHYREFDGIFTGDVEGAGEERLIRRMRDGEGRLIGRMRDGEEKLIGRMRDGEGRYELLSVAHHGSENSTLKEFLELVRPRVSVISCGRNNRYGHPHEALMERLIEAGTRVFRTDLLGAVRVWSDGRRVRVTCFGV